MRLSCVCLRALSFEQPHVPLGPPVPQLGPSNEMSASHQALFKAFKGISVPCWVPTGSQQRNSKPSVSLKPSRQPKPP